MGLQLVSNSDTIFPMHALKKFLKENQITAPQLGKMLGVERQAVYRWLAGTRRPGWNSIGKLMKITNGAVTADSFVAHKKSNTETPSTS